MTVFLTLFALALFGNLIVVSVMWLIFMNLGILYVPPELAWLRRLVLLKRGKEALEIGKGPIIAQEELEPKPRPYYVVIGEQPIDITYPQNIDVGGIMGDEPVFTYANTFVILGNPKVAGFANVAWPSTSSIEAWLVEKPDYAESNAYTH